MEVFMLKKDFTIAGIVMLFMGVGLFIIISFLGYAISALFGGTLFPKNYSKKHVKEFISDFAPDATYITRKKIKESKTEYYLCEDAYGRDFVIESTSIEGIFLYHPELFDSYECCIFQIYIDEIKKILDNTRLSYKIYPEDVLELQDDMLTWAMKSPSTMPRNIHFFDIEEDDIPIIANAAAEIDKILNYNYNKKCKSKFHYKGSYGGEVSIIFKGLEYHNTATFYFSNEEATRWTKSSLQENIQHQYQENIRVIEEDKKAAEREEQKEKDQEAFEQSIRMDILDYLSEKYDETFVVDDSSHFDMNDTNDEVFFMLYCDRLPYITITVHGTKNTDGTFSYTDDFTKGKKNNNN